MKTDFMHLFDMKEIDLEMRSLDYICSNNPYINAILNAQINGSLNIPYVELIAKRGGFSHISFSRKYAIIHIQGYGGGASLLASIEIKNLVYYDMTKLSKIMISHREFGGIDWGKYRNKKGIIDDSKKIKFLTDLIKHKTIYQCNL